MSSSGTDALGVDSRRIDSTLVLTLNRTEAGNALDLDTARALWSALDRCRNDSSLRTVVITGAGEKFFCTGGDIKRYRTIENPTELDEAFGLIRNLLDLIEDLDRPVIAAINGFAIGGGVELALACDIRIADRSARLSLPQSRIGIIPGWNGIERLVETVGRSTAMRLLLSGRQHTAQEALAFGLVDEVAQEGAALDAALKCAAEFDGAAPLTIGATKRTVLHSLRSSREVSRAYAAATLSRLWFSDDHREAEAAFVERRPPRFRSGDT